MMLGCHDFCGYYDWTFHYVRREFGQQAVRDLWAQAIGGDSQAHYAQGGARGGLRGLLNTWTKTGEDEQCDWTFTLDEERNVLRWDMRHCPSKGFLIQNDLNADEDYCDHCMGWIIPLLARLGAVVTHHEHNHCGQCWAEISMKDRPCESLHLEADIRRDPLWNHGYIDCWKDSVKLPLLGEVSTSPDPCEVLRAWFARTDEVTVLEPGVRELDSWSAGALPHDLVVTDDAYVAAPERGFEPLAVLFGEAPADLAAAAERFRATPASKRPLFMYAYLPAVLLGTEFVSVGLPRPVPILPLLIRERYYVHQPGGPHPAADTLLVMLAHALGKRLHVLGDRSRDDTQDSSEDGGLP
jgi:hypothetical protein